MAKLKFKEWAAKRPVEYALAYATRGWYVFPVWSVDENGNCRCGRPNDEKGHAPGKHPHEFSPSGFHGATTDPEIIRRWYDNDPYAGIGIAMAASGLIAMDIDRERGGFETLAALEAEHGSLHSECVATTQNGGEHRVFRAEDGFAYPGGLGQGIDVKHNGYICVQPTSGAEGTYRWKNEAFPLNPDAVAGVAPLPKLIKDRSRAQNDAAEQVTTAPVATPETFRDLKQALTFISAEDYGTWFKVGLALKPYGEEGFELWNTWSKTSDKYNADAQRRKWERDISMPHNMTYRSIFYLAIENGWHVTPGRDIINEWNQGDAEHPYALSNAVMNGTTGVQPMEYVFDDFMSVGTNVIAGAPGVGKTTLVVPLALSAAHICKPDYPLKPRIRRNVIIITESITQVQNVIRSIHRQGVTGCAVEDYEDRIAVIEARRLRPKVVVQVAEEYRQWTVENKRADGTMHLARPLVVFDTSSAVFDLEDENSNAAVSNTMAAIKESFAGFPVIIVGHSAKALGDATEDDMSPRGASAWAGDAQGVYVAFKDGKSKNAPRVLKATKVRFATEFTELGFNLKSMAEHSVDFLGYPADVTLVHAEAYVLEEGEREAAKQAEKEAKQAEREAEKEAKAAQREADKLARDAQRVKREVQERAEKELMKQAQRRERKDGLLGLISLCQHERRATNWYALLEAKDGGVRGSYDSRCELIEELVGDGEVVREAIDPPVNRQNHYLRVAD